MSFGVTPEGFNKKRLADIQNETVDEFKAAFGDGFDLDPRTPAGQIKGTLDERESSVWDVLDALYFAAYPDTAEGVPLDNAASLTGTTRKEATPSAVSG